MEFNISNRIISVTEKESPLSYNSDYIANFRFDEEWNDAIKTARFIQGGKYVDVILDKNDSCNMPIFKTGWVIVGVFNNIMTTTYTKIYFNRTIKDENSDQAEEPTPDVYSQLLEAIESGMLKGEKGDKGDKGDPGADGYTPVKGNDYFTEEDINTYVRKPINELKDDLTEQGTRITALEQSGGTAGKSAYQIAVDNGFTGTEAEWLASLKGAKGDPFRYEDFTQEQLEALKGTDGYTPVKGKDYFDGAKGDPFTYEDFTPEQLASLKGSDANVTPQNIISALGYTPADQKNVEQLSKDIINQADLVTEVTNQLDGAKADIVADIIAQLGGMPLFGTVDDNNTITVQSTLAEGDYTIMYENEDGSLTEVGTITVSGIVEESYTNLFSTSGSGFTDNSTKFYTNWLPYNQLDNDGNGTIYHFKGLLHNAGYINPYKMNFATDENGTGATSQFYCSNANVQAVADASYDSSVKIVQHNTNDQSYKYVRFEIRETLPANLIITANQDIIDK